MSNSRNDDIQMEYRAIPQSSAELSVVQDNLSPPTGESGDQVEDGHAVLPTPENQAMQNDHGVVNPTPEDGAMHDTDNRTPVILHPFVGWGVIAICVIMGAAVISLYCVSQRRNGFPIYVRHTFRDEVDRFFWSSGPALPMTILTGLILAPFAFSVWLHAPFTELEQGPAPAEISIFMNWITQGPFRRIYLAWRHRRPGLVTLGFATLLSGFLPIVASGLLGPRTIIADNPVNVRITAHLGMAPSSEGVSDGQGNHIFGSTNQYLQAASSASAQISYSPLPAPFAFSSQETNVSVTPLFLSRNDVAQHVFDSSVGANLTAEVYAVEASANCNAAGVTFGDNDMVIATLDECSYSFQMSTNQSFDRWHFADSTPCNNASRYDVAFKTFVYVVYRPSNSTNARPDRFLVMFCSPSISILKVSAKISFTMQNDLGALVEPPTIKDKFSIDNTTDEHAITLLQPPLNGNAVNGYDLAQEPGTWNFSRTARANLTKSLLFEGIYSALQRHMAPDNVTDPVASWFTPQNREQMGRIITGFYQTYVSTFSRSIYFNPGANDTTIDATLSALSSRLFVARLNAGGLSGLLFLLAILIAVTLIKQPRPRSGGIAVRLGADSSPGRIMQVLHNWYFREDHRYSADPEQGLLIHAEREDLHQNP